MVDLPVDGGVGAAGRRVREDVGGLSGGEVSDGAGLDAAAAAAAGRLRRGLRCELSAGFRNNLRAGCSSGRTDRSKTSLNRLRAGRRSWRRDVRDGVERRRHLVSLNWLSRCLNLLGNGDGRLASSGDSRGSLGNRKRIHEDLAGDGFLLGRNIRHGRQRSGRMRDSHSSRFRILSYGDCLRPSLPVCWAWATSLAILAGKNEASVAGLGQGGESNQSQRSKRVHFVNDGGGQVGQRK